jgi:hypothetical protein
MSAKYILAAAFVAATTVLTVTSAHATTGREAVDSIAVVLYVMSDLR